MGGLNRLLLACALAGASTGCGLLEAGVRSANDDRGDRYESKSYAQHWLDVAFEEDDEPECHETTVVVVR